MAVAAGAVNLGPGHEEPFVDTRLNCSRHGLVKARPAGAAVEFCCRAEQGMSAPRAIVSAWTVGLVEGAGARWFGAVAAEDAILLGR